MKNKDEILAAIEYWRNEYWSNLQKSTDDSEDKQEKYCFTISSGAVGIILGTMGFLIDLKYVGFAVAALIVFTFSMLLCVIYHIVAKNGHQKQFDLINAFLANPEKGDSVIRETIKKANHKLDVISIICAILIFVGVVLYSVYIIKNV